MVKDLCFEIIQTCPNNCLFCSSCAGMDKLVIKYDGTLLPGPAFKEFDTSILNKMGIKTPNIHTDIECIQVHNGTRAYPLCKNYMTLMEL